METLEKKSFYFLLKDKLQTAGISVECFSLDDNINDLDEFDTDDITISVGYNSGYISITIDFKKNHWYISVDSGYFQIGKNYSISDKNTLDIMIHLIKTVL
jgi:hypothetical protein